MTNEYEYDLKDRLNAVIDERGKNGKTDLLKTQYEYDDTTGNIKRIIDQKGISTDYVYDNDNNLTTIFMPSVGLSDSNSLSYTYGVNTTVSSGTKYSYSYDGFGRTTEVQICGVPYLGNYYSEENGTEYIQTTLNTGEAFKTYYDKYDRPILSETYTVSGSTSERYEYLYDECGNLKKIVDKDSGLMYNETNYNNKGFVSQKIDFLQNEIVSLVTDYSYSGNNLSSVCYIMGSDTYTTKYDYEDSPDNRLLEISLPSRAKYYLQSRYYDPKVGRFINSDDARITLTYATTLNGLNLYSYCVNNPVMNDDPTGHLVGATIWLVISIFGFLVSTLALIRAINGVREDASSSNIFNLVVASIFWVLSP